MGPWPHCEKQPALLMRTSTWRPAASTPARSVLTNFSTSPWVGQVSPPVHTNTWRAYWPMLSSLSAKDLEQPDAIQIVVHGVDHQQHQEHQPHLLRDLPLPQR